MSFLIPWCKELPHTFYVSAPNVFVCLFFLIPVIPLLVYGLAAEFTGSVVIWLLFFSLPAFWGIYLLVVWVHSVRKERNRAIYTHGAITLRRSNYRDPYVWSLGVLVLLPTWYILLWAYALFVDTEESLRRQILLHPVTILIVAVICLILLPIASFQAPGMTVSLRLTPSGIEMLYGARSALKIDWDSIRDIQLQVSGMQVNAHLASDARQPIKRNILGSRIEGLNYFDVKGFDTEPNAILRVVRECVRNPDARVVLGTPEGVDFVTFGPSWKQVQKMKVGDTWSGDSS